MRWGLIPSASTSLQGALLTCTAPLLHLADEDAQAVLRAAPHTETQSPCWTLLHPDSADDITLITVGCVVAGAGRDTGMTPMSSLGTEGPWISQFGLVY